MVYHCVAFKRCVNGLNDRLGEQWCRHVRVARRGMSTKKGLNEAALRRATHHAAEMELFRFGVGALALSSSSSLVTVGTGKGKAGDATDADLFQEGGNQVRRP